MKLLPSLFFAFVWALIPISLLMISEEDVFNVHCHLVNDTKTVYPLDLIYNVHTLSLTYQDKHGIVNQNNVNWQHMNQIVPCYYTSNSNVMRLGHIEYNNILYPVLLSSFIIFLLIFIIVYIEP